MHRCSSLQPFGKHSVAALTSKPAIAEWLASLPPHASMHCWVAESGGLFPISLAQVFIEWHMSEHSWARWSEVAQARSWPTLASLYSVQTSMTEPRWQPALANSPSSESRQPS